MPAGRRPHQTRAIRWQIRDAVIGDSPAIAQIQVDSYRTAYAGMFPQTYLNHFTCAEQEQDWQATIGSDARDIVLVAASEGNGVIGYALTRSGVGIHLGYDSEVVALHVRSIYQRQGTGRALLCAALERLEERGCRSVMLWTLRDNRVREWYEGLNGQLIDEKQYDVDGWDIIEAAYGWENLSSLLQTLRSSVARSLAS